MSVQLINERTSVPLMILAMAIFGTIGVMTHYIDMPAALIVLIRGSVGTLSLLALVLFIRYRLDVESISANLFVLVASGTCLGLNWVFLFEAYKTTAISTATLCNYLTPAFVLLVSPLFLGERFTVLKAAVVGVAIVIAYTFVVSMLLYWVTNRMIPMRVSPKSESLGLDASQHDEVYGLVSA